MRKVFLALVLFVLAGLAAGCSSASNNSNTGNVNPANGNPQLPVGQNNTNPTLDPNSVPAGTDPTKGVNPAPNVHPGPDNSDIETVMDKGGDVTETRVFKNNPNVSKVVVVTSARDGKIKRTVTVYDKAGKTHSVPEDQSESVLQATGDDVAHAAKIVAGKTKDIAVDTKETTVDASKTAADKTKAGANEVVNKTRQGVDAVKKKLP